MLFNSIEFLIYLPIVFILYWFFLNKSLRLQNFFILVASYVFYGWWDWRFLSLIVISSSVDFFIGLNLPKAKTNRVRRLLLIGSIVLNIGFLGFFKYYNFFVDSFIDAFASAGFHLNPRTLNIVLPVGISFYTFQTLSYTIDVYRKKLEPSKDIVAFFAFVSFFPQLVAGPIERATNLLPQFYKKRVFDPAQATDGLRQMLWGFFKKVVVADNLDKLVVPIFDQPGEMNTLVLIMGLGLFSVQIYCDFAGYSDIAIGLSRLFGFNLKTNFRYPLFARNIGERWRNWHISLSTWFRDYIYIPLGGSRGDKYSKFKNVMILFTISGLWHGANWNFVAWGFINGLFFAPSMLLGTNRKYLDTIASNRFFPSFREFTQILTTFSLIAFTYIFFRADNIQHSWEYFDAMIHNIQVPFSSYQVATRTFVLAILVAVILLIAEWMNRTAEHTLDFTVSSPPRFARWSIYIVVIFFVIVAFDNNPTNFIYFQF